jgi:hypothetical protein
MDHCCLRRAVVRVRPRRLGTLDGPNQDDRPTTAPPTHHRCGGLDRREAPDQIGVDDRSPLRHRHRRKLSHRLHTSVRDNGIQPTERLTAVAIKPAQPPGSVTSHRTETARPR